MAVRKIKRGKKTVLVIDIRDPRLPGGRLRKNAERQDVLSARHEEREIRENLAKHGQAVAPDERAGMTLAQFWDELYEPTVLALRKPATRISYASVWSRPVTGLRGLLGHVPLVAINGMSIAKAAAVVRKEKVSPRPMLILLKSMLRAAVDLEVLQGMPRIPRGLYTEPAKLPEAPEPSEAKALVEGSEGWLRAALVLSLYCGLRMGEVRALRPGDIDLERRFVFVRRAYSENELTLTKTCAERMIPIADEAMPYIRDAILGLPADALIVSQRDGSPMRRQNMLAAYKRLRRKLGLKPAAYHLTRHFFVSQLVAAGVDAETGRSLSGHLSMASFARYVHTTDARRREAVGRITLGTDWAPASEKQQKTAAN